MQSTRNQGKGITVFWMLVFTGFGHVGYHTFPCTCY